MRFPLLRSRRKLQDLSRETAFAEATELAQLRLEQCISELQNYDPDEEHPESEGTPLS
jgi:hypothetical protein